ncbi:hypothetical protein F4821DRAFT_250489 [Hypoxylon rubiginosum]|uniref:Uncharacterized protein n=1 Tax=Hypoxylon rubiginosum TaxID=110542 RepID=A0ACC0CKP1_9PEZI|nr:hypothetical protein F4821DRAFT_250489 [Hypoxylon rubiginosum]
MCLAPMSYLAKTLPTYLGTITIIADRALRETPQEMPVQRSIFPKSEDRKNQIGRTCKCRYIRRTSRQSSEWGSFTRSNESIIGLYFVGCIVSLGPTTSLGVLGIKMMEETTNTLLELCTKRSNIGSFSISPTLLYYTIVEKLVAFGHRARRALSRQCGW